MTIDIDRYVDVTAGVAVGAAGSSSGGAGFDPGSLGHDLYLSLDPADTDTVTLDGSGYVTRLTDSVGGRQFDAPNQAGSPLFDPTGFNGFPGIKPDGVNDWLNYEAGLNIPAPFEIFYLYNALRTGAGTDTLFDWGTGDNSQTLSLRSLNASTLRYSALRIPRQDAIATVNNQAADRPFVGLNLLHGVVYSGLVGTPQHQLYVNGVAGTSNNILPIFLNSGARCRLFSRADGAFYLANGIFGGMWITALLDTERRAKMLANLRARLV